MYDSVQHRVRTFCVQCGRQISILTEKHNHTVTITHYATCTDPAIVNVQCRNCEYSRTESQGNPLGHDYWVEVTNIPATCTTAGKIVNRCARCDETQTAILPALGHRYGEWTMTGQTADNQRVESRTCTVCNDDTEERTVKPGKYCHQITLEQKSLDKELLITTTVYTDQGTPFSTVQALLNYLNSLVNFDYLVCTGSVRYYDPYANRWATGSITRFGRSVDNALMYYYTRVDGTEIPVIPALGDLSIADTVG